MGFGNGGAVSGAATVEENGFDAGFLRQHQLPLPQLDATLEPDIAPTLAGEPVRRYTHFSLQMSASRRFCRWVAWNIDGTQIQKIARGGFRFDPAYDRAVQVGEDIYKNNQIDRGHIARRADVTWGSEAEASQANADSMFFTNITPQAADFNKPLPKTVNKGLWGELEDTVFDEIPLIDDRRLSVFGGPVLDPEKDFPFKDVLIPRSFWKIVAYSEAGTLRARAFVLTQLDLEHRVREAAPWDAFNVYGHRIAELQEMVGIDFGPLADADVFPEDAPVAARRIRSRDEVLGDR
jgi:endonuclease G